MNRDDEAWPQPTSPAATSVMKANTGRETDPETAVRSLLHRRGFRFRKRHTIRLADRRWTRPDLVFMRERVAVFVDGCFWHSCPEHGTSPRSNTGYWGPKLEGNAVRDSDTNRQLEQMGWAVFRAWEHEDPLTVADSVSALVLGRRTAVQSTS